MTRTDLIRQYTQAAVEVVAETIWPTRCAVCDAPGAVLCDECRAALTYLDWWRACKRCGAPLGRIQCTECNDVILASTGRDTLAYEGCASAVMFDQAAARIVRTWKDAGERRLAYDMATLMARCLPPAWRAVHPTIVAIPATSAAVRRRGFDHAHELAHALAQQCELPLAPLLARPRAHDQRALSRRERIENMQGRFRVMPGANVAPVVLLVDDVFTTGATLSAASDALRAAGARSIYCLTFARVW